MQLKELPKSNRRLKRTKLDVLEKGELSFFRLQNEDRISIEIRLYVSVISVSLNSYSLNNTLEATVVI